MYQFVLGKEVVLNNGRSLPVAGLSTYYLKTEGIVHDVIDNALDIGYRLFDTSPSNRNEHMLRNAFADKLPKHDLDRSKIFIISKLTTAVPDAFGSIRHVLFNSLFELGTDYVDLFILSESISTNINLVAAWHDALILKQEGYARSIGVANFNSAQLEALVNADLPPPQVLQVAYNPLCRIDSVLPFSVKYSVHIQAYSPFGDPMDSYKRLFTNRVLRRIAADYDAPVPQVILMWLLQKGIGVLPATANPNHLMENLDFELRLGQSAIQLINSMGPPPNGIVELD